MRSWSPLRTGGKERPAPALRWLVALLLGVVSCTLAACGAGVGAAALLSKNGSRRPPPEVRPPELSLPEPSGPLFPPIDVLPIRTVVISNYEIQSSSALRIEVRALGAISVQTSPLILSSAPGASVLGFILQNSEISARIPDLTAADVDATLAVIVDGKEIATPAPFLLRKQPRASLIPPAGETLAFVSVLGGTRLSVRVNYLLGSTSDDVQIQVGVADPNGTIRVQRCTDLTISTEREGAEAIVTGVVPSSPYAGPVYAAVVDSRAGSSTLVPGVFYRAALDVVSPRTSATEGGEVVTLAGTAMVPYDRKSVPAKLDFSALSVRLRRGGREVVVPAVSMRPDLSSQSRLVFTVPPSPDGRAGPADVVLRADFGGGVVAETIASGLFVYGYSTPLFGPRGTVLPESPTRLALAPIEGLTPDGDLAMLSSLGGLSRVFLFAAQGNGMYTRLGAPFEGGLLADPAQRLPSDLLATDLDGDGRRDLFVLNRGGTQGANHGLLLNKPKPAPPLAFIGGVLATQPGLLRVVSGDLDEDGLGDLVMLPRPAAYLARTSSSVTGGPPSFLSVDLSALGSGPFDAVAVADLDGDRHLDLAFAVGGTTPRLVTAYGTGTGTFALGQNLALVIPGYTGSALSPVVGIHACGLGPRRSLAVVLAGRVGEAGTKPTVAVLSQATSTRVFDAPEAGAVLAIPGTDEAFSASVAADLDADGLVEMVVAHAGQPNTPLRLLVWNNDRFLERVGAVETGIEAPRDIRQLLVEGKALKVSHAVLVDSSEEHRVSTWMIGAGPSLAAPDAGRSLADPLWGVAVGDFRGLGGSTADAFVATSGAVTRLLNDGNGGFQPELRIPIPRLLPRAIKAMRLSLPPGATGDGLLFLTDDARIGWLPPRSTAPLLLDTDLRRFGPTTIHTRAVSEESRMLASDVDGDGLMDLVLLLSCVATGGERREGEALLFVLRGRVVAAPTEFPVVAPEPGLTVARVHGNATGPTVGDFVRESGTACLEAAVAIPNGDSGDPAAGSHVRFFRYEAGSSAAADRFVRSFAEDAKAVLVAGDEPQEIVASDFDGNGTTDLAVASSGDQRLRIFLNSGVTLASRPLDVNIGAFLESFGSPPALPPGRPRAIFLGDINGDGIADLLVPTTADTSVVTNGIGLYTSSGNGGLTLSGIVPPVRSGDLVGSVTGGFVPRNAPAVMAVGDVNRDGSVDLLIGWPTTGPGDRNLRVLFGGAR